MTEIAGRVAELAALDQVLDGAARGAAPLVLLRGEPGIGKTIVLAFDDIHWADPASLEAIAH